MKIKKEVFNMGKALKRLCMLATVLFVMAAWGITAKADVVIDYDCNGTLPTKEGTGTVNWAYDHDAKTLTISGSGELDYEPKLWFDYSYEGIVEWSIYKATAYGSPVMEIDKVITSGNIKVVGRSGEYMFSMEKSPIKQSIDLSGLVFDDCTSLVSFFSKNPDLTEITGWNNNLLNVEKAYYMFNGCSSLTSVGVDSFNMPKLTDAAGMFKECSSLTSIPVVKSGKLTNCKDMYESTNVSDININYLQFADGCDISFLLSKTAIGPSFVWPSSLDTSKCANVGYLFYDCDNLKQLDLSYFNNIGATTSYHIAGDCDNLETIILGQNITAELYDNSSGYKFLDSQHGYEFEDTYGLIKLTTIQKIGSVYPIYCPGARSQTAYFTKNGKELYTCGDKIYDAGTYFSVPKEITVKVKVGTSVLSKTSSIDISEDKTIDNNETWIEPASMPTKKGYTIDYTNAQIQSEWSDYLEFDKGKFKVKKFPTHVNNDTLLNDGIIISVPKSDMTPTKYSINYILDGGTNDSRNPNTYTIKDDDITLYDPQKSGYLFKGWYLQGDEGYIDEIPKGSTGDKTLYAEWQKCTHNYVSAPYNHTLKSEATCTSPAIYYKSCNMCGMIGTETFEYGSPLGHEWHEVDGSAKQNTCGVAGKEADKICSRCNLVDEGATIAATGNHTPAAAVKENETAPTCIADGCHDEVIKCSVCGNELSRETKTDDKLGHDWGDWVETVAATETTKGEETRTCKRKGCSEQDKRDIPELGHTHTIKKVDAVPSTCKVAGNILYYECESCHKLFSDEDGKNEINIEDTVAQLAAHKPGSAIKSNEIAETCDKDGSYTETVLCTVCGDVISKKTIPVKSKGHNYSSWTITKQPTAEDSGIMERTCSRCGHKETDVVASTGNSSDSSANTETGKDTPSGTENEQPSITDNGTTYDIKIEGGKAKIESVQTDKKEVTIPTKYEKDGITYKVTEISEGAFKNASSLEKVVIKKGITTIQKKAFLGCKNLKSVSIASTVKEIKAEAFSGCESLTKITIPKNVTKIEANAFKGCKNLKKITIKSTKIKKIGKKAFKGCHKDLSFKVPKTAKTKLKKMIKKSGSNAKVK